MRLRAGSSRSAAPDIDEEDSYQGDENNSMKLSHAFFVVLILHLILIGGIFGFNYIKARQIPSLPTANTSSAGYKNSATENSTSESTKDTAEKPSATSPPQNSASHIADSSIIPTGSTPNAPPTATTSEKVTPSPQFRTHRVAAGETLQRIASAYGVTVSQIEEANNRTPISDGQVLKIPFHTSTNTMPSLPHVAVTPTEIRKSTPPQPASPTGPPSPHKPASHQTSKSQETISKGEVISPEGIHGAKGIVKTEGYHKIYVVVSGDNPYSIARRFKVNYVELLKTNHIEDPTKLQIGAKLQIPKSQ